MPKAAPSRSISVERVPPKSRWFPVDQMCESGWYWLRNPVYPHLRDRIVYLSDEMVSHISKTLPGSTFQRVPDPMP